MEVSEEKKKIKHHVRYLMGGGLGVIRPSSHTALIHFSLNWPQLELVYPPVAALSSQVQHKDHRGCLRAPNGP